MDILFGLKTPYMMDEQAKALSRSGSGNTESETTSSKKGNKGNWRNFNAKRKGKETNKSKFKEGNELTIKKGKHQERGKHTS